MPQFFYISDFTPWTTLWTASPALNANDSGDENYSFRNVCIVAGNATQVRITYDASLVASFSADNCAIAKQTSGAASTAPLEVKFSSASGFTISAAGQLVCDPVDFVVANGDALMPIIDISASNGNPRINTGAAGDSYLKAATNSYNDASAAGFSVGGRTYGVSKIEGRSAL